MHIDRIPLPGIGINYILTSADGRRLGVICHFDGRREVTMYDTDEPDTVERSVVLKAEEADRLSDVLSEMITVDHLKLFETAIAGVDLAKIQVTADSPFAGASMGRTRARSKTTASIVAVIRNGKMVTGPDSSFVFSYGDVIVAAGSVASVEALARLAAGDER